MIGEVTHGKEPDGFFVGHITPRFTGTIENGVVTHIDKLYDFGITI